MTFGEYVAHHKLARAEGVVLRYLTDAYRALRSTVPGSARTEEVDDLVEWLGEVVRHTDSSLLDEWEALTNPDEPVTEVRAPTEGRALTANPRALRVMVRQSMFRRVELLALGRYAALAALDGGLGEEEWAAAAAGYFTEYDDLGTGPAARGPAFFRVVEEDGVWHVTQILDDPEGDHDWRITAELDLAATDEAGRGRARRHGPRPRPDPPRAGIEVIPLATARVCTSTPRPSRPGRGDTARQPERQGSTRRGRERVGGGQPLGDAVEAPEDHRAVAVVGQRPGCGPARSKEWRASSTRPSRR